MRAYLSMVPLFPHSNVSRLVPKDVLTPTLPLGNFVVLTAVGFFSTKRTSAWTIVSIFLVLYAMFLLGSQSPSPAYYVDVTVLVDVACYVIRLDGSGFLVEINNSCEISWPMWARSGGRRLVLQFRSPKG